MSRQVGQEVLAGEGLQDLREGDTLGKVELGSMMWICSERDRSDEQACGRCISERGACCLLLAHVRNMINCISELAL